MALYIVCVNYWVSSVSDDRSIVCLWKASSSDDALQKTLDHIGVTPDQVFNHTVVTATDSNIGVVCRID